MKRILLGLTGVLAGMASLFGQPNPDTLLITECYIGGHPGNPYVEITNMGNQPVDLAKYFIMSATNGGVLGSTTGSYLRLSGTLQAGASYLIVGNRKFPDLSTPEPNDSTDSTPAYYRAADYDLMLPNFGTGTGGAPGFEALRVFEGDDAIAIGWDVDGDGLWKQSLGDLVVDQVGLLAADGGARYVYPDVAGVTDAPVNNVLIRKFSIKLPNRGNFLSGLGVGSEDSDWIVIPFDPNRTSDFFKTVKRHNASDPYQLSSTAVTIGENSINVPWGIRRDSLYQSLDFGDNMAWFLRWGPDTLESVLTQEKDTLYVYLAGNNVTIKKYGVKVDPPLAGMNLAFPRFDRNDENEIFLRYDVSDDFDPDTIANVPFGTRIDTLFAYMEKAPKASWEIDFVDDVARPDLKTGDKLVVTAENGAKKEYYIDVNEYVASSNAYLGAIYIYGDTLFGFKRNLFDYIEMIPPDTEFPALSATPENLNAKVKIVRPANIRGGREDRTAFITVTAPDDSTELVYTVTFEVMSMKETFSADPFFSQVMNGIGNMTPGSTASSGWGKGFEIFNPGNTAIPMGDYLIATATAQTFTQVVSSKDMQYRMRPGYTMDSARLGVGIYFNQRTYPFITDLDPGKVLTFGRGNPPTMTGNPFRAYCDYLDCNGDNAFAFTRYGFVDGSRIAFFGTNVSFFLIRIDNDSIFNGLKPGGNPADYTLVDIFGAQGVNNNRTIEGTLVSDMSATVLERKKEIWKGNPDNHGSFGTATPGSSEWDKFQGAMFIGTHPYTPYTGYISTVYSLAYKVSPDFGPEQTIGMVPPGTTVDAFLSNVMTNGADALLSVTDADSTVVKTGTTIIATGDKLNVVSGTKKNVTKYSITVEQPSNNAALSSSVYTININGANGQVNGVPSFTSIADLLSNLSVPAGAMLTVVDTDGQQVGLEKVLFDTLIAVPTVVNDKILLEVIAEDGVTKIMYQLGIAVDQPYVTSDFFMVYQDRQLIDMFQANMLVKTFLSRLVPSTGATMTVVDNMSNVRGQDDIMYKDDILMVTAGTVTTSYHLKDMFDAFSTDASLKDLKVDGMTVTGFDPATLTYTIVLEQGSNLPVVVATANRPSSLMDITQASDLQGNEEQRTASVMVTAEDGETVLTYKILFNLNIGVDENVKQILRIYAEGKNIVILSPAVNHGDEVQLFNITGQRILHRKINTTFERIPIADPSGIYIVKVRSEGKTYIEKLVIN